MTDNIQRDLGILMTEVKHLRDDMDRDEHRRKSQYERIEAIERKIDKLVDAVNALVPRVKRGEEAADKLDRISTMGKGYLVGVGVMSFLGGGGLVMFLHDKIVPLLKAAWKG